LPGQYHHLVTSTVDTARCRMLSLHLNAVVSQRMAMMVLRADAAHMGCVVRRRQEEESMRLAVQMA
jgi:hypothetical protein